MAVAVPEKHISLFLQNKYGVPVRKMMSLQEKAQSIGVNNDQPIVTIIDSG